MSDISDLVKEIAIEAQYALKPVSVTTGRVTDEDELKIDIEQKLVLTEDFLIRGDRFKYRTFEKGDRLILLRCDGGQKYLIFDTF